MAEYGRKNILSIPSAFGPFGFWRIYQSARVNGRSPHYGALRMQSIDMTDSISRYRIEMVLAEHIPDCKKNLPSL